MCGNVTSFVYVHLNEFNCHTVPLSLYYISPTCMVKSLLMILKLVKITMKVCIGKKIYNANLVSKLTNIFNFVVVRSYTLLAR